MFPLTQIIPLYFWNNFAIFGIKIVYVSIYIDTNARTNSFFCLFLCLFYLITLARVNRLIFYLTPFIYLTVLAFTSFYLI